MLAKVQDPTPSMEKRLKPKEQLQEKNLVNLRLDKLSKRFLLVDSKKIIPKTILDSILKNLARLLPLPV